VGNQRLGGGCPCRPHAGVLVLAAYHRSRRAPDPVAPPRLASGASSLFCTGGGPPGLSGQALRRCKILGSKARAIFSAPAARPVVRRAGRRRGHAPRRQSAGPPVDYAFGVSRRGKWCTALKPRGWRGWRGAGHVLPKRLPSLPSHSPTYDGQERGRRPPIWTSGPGFARAPRAPPPSDALGG
jgi:hypothetical protein